MSKIYATAAAFRTALEERLRNRSRQTGVDIQRLRRQVAFDRLLNRLFQSFPQTLFLKGGYAMELRIQEARTTKDIDLVLKTGGKENEEAVIRQMLQDATRKDIGDFFEFLVGTSTLDLEAIPYGGFRYPVEVFLDGRLFIRFPMDIVISSLFLDPIDRIKGEDWLGFAGIEPVSFPAISKEQQFAEKLHAYTLLRDEKENSRVKDLADMLLLIQLGNLDRSFLNQAIRKTFEYRNTHAMPNGLFEPPTDWIPKFDKLRRECNLSFNLDEGMGTLAGYLNLPILVRNEATFSSGLKGKCHFCEEEGLVAQVPNYNMTDTDCLSCGPYRMTGLFKSVNNATNNPDNWRAWGLYLQSRSGEIKKRRVKISTANFLPPR